ALIAADGPMVEPHRPVPRQADVPFHVAIEAEPFTEKVQPEIRRIASAGAEAFPVPAIRRNPEDGSFALEDRRGVGLGDVLAVGQAGAVSRHQIKPSVESAQDRVRVVVATRPERVSQATNMPQRPPGIITLEKLQAVAPD